MASDDLLRHFYGGFIRLHILYHAAHEAIYGAEMMEELRRHGYKLGPGTMYPILHGLEKSGYVSREDQLVAGKRRKTYRLTRKGQRLLTDAQAKLRELVGEVVYGATPHVSMKRSKPTGKLRRGESLK